MEVIMKKTICLISSAFFVVSIIIFGYVFFQSIDYINYKLLTMQYILSYFLLVCGALSLFLLKKQAEIDSCKIKKIAISIGCALTVIGLSIGIAGYATSYDDWYSEPIWKNSDEKINDFFPYRHESKDDMMDVDYKSCMVADYISLGQSDYGIEYFTSKSCLLNKKFKLERDPRSPLGEYGNKVIDFDPEEKRCDGIDLLLYVDDEDNYEVMINNCFSTFSIYLYVGDKNITEDEFVEEAVRQYKLVKKAIGDDSIRNIANIWK